MSDLLSASSLLMAIAAILFSLWYADIAKALEIVPKKFKEDNVADYHDVKNVIYAKAVPVAVMAGLVAVIFLPDAITITIESIKIYRKGGLQSIVSGYNAVKTAYCYVSLLSAILAVYMFILVKKLCALCAELK